MPRITPTIACRAWVCSNPGCERWGTSERQWVQNDSGYRLCAALLVELTESTELARNDIAGA